MNVRPKLLLTVLALGVIAVGVHAHVWASVRNGPPVARPPVAPPLPVVGAAPAPAPAPQPADPGFVDLGTVHGAGLTADKAREQALRKAREAVLEYLRKENVS